MMWVRLGILAKYILAALPMVPALAINIDWSGKTAPAWVLAAVFGIILAPVIIEASRHARPWYVGIFLLVVGVFGMYVNGLVAMKTASITNTQNHNKNLCFMLSPLKQSPPLWDRRRYQRMLAQRILCSTTAFGN